MNIGIDAKRLFFNNSGLGNYGRRFYQALAKKSPADTFHLYSPKAVPENNPYLSIVNSGNSTITSPESSFNRMFGGALWRSGLVTKQLKKDEIDVYYGISNEIPFGIKKLKTIKVVVIHDLIFLRYPELYPAIDVYFYRKKTRYACQNADYIIAASGQTRSDLANFYQVPLNKITVIYPGTDPSFYSGDIADPNEFFKTERKYLISIGAITPRKNLLKTVQAFKLVKDKFDLDLVVVGNAVGMGRAYLKKIEEFIDLNGLSGRVHFLGNVPYKYLPGLCRNAQIMIYPSQFEGFGMPITEGFFSKIPVITSHGGCFPEAGGDGAVYINPDNFEEIVEWIEKLMESETLRNDLVTKGFQHAEKFRQEHIENDILNFHQAIKAGRNH